MERSNWRFRSERRQIRNQKPSYLPCRHLNRRKSRAEDFLLLPFAASFFCNIRHIKRIWRKRVGVEPTILAAKDRINGFEGHEDHRTSFASASIIGTSTGGFNFSGR